MRYQRNFEGKLFFVPEPLSISSKPDELTIKATTKLTEDALRRIYGIDLGCEKTKVELPEKYIINENATILFWKDGEKTVVRKTEDDEFNPRLGFLTAFFQHYCGMSRNKANKYLAGLEVEAPKNEKKKTIEERNIEPIEFKNGDRVIHHEYGKGIVIDATNLLIEFDNARSFLHDGNGRGKQDHCWWCVKNSLIKEEE